MAEGGGEQPRHLGLGLGHHHRLGGNRVQLALQHRRIPEEVAAVVPHQSAIGLRRNPVELGQQCLNAAHPPISLSLTGTELVILPRLRSPKGRRVA